MPKLTISIVNFNAGEYLLRCLRSVKKEGIGLDFKTFVVDNASSDGSPEKAEKEFPEIELIKNKENVGFGKAHNQVLRKLNSEYALILNPDVELKDGVLKEMISFMDEHPDVGAATCKIILPDSSIDWAAHRGFPTPLASLLYFLGNDSLYHLSNRDFNETHEVDAISGSFFLTRKAVLSKVGSPAGGFDEDYFMYAEDIDLCFRIKKAGFKIMYVPHACTLHYKGVSSGLKKHSRGLTAASLETKKRSLNAFYGTMKIFYRKHYEKKYPFVINRLIFLGINLKWFLAKRKLEV